MAYVNVHFPLNIDKVLDMYYFSNFGSLIPNPYKWLSGQESLDEIIKITE